MIVGILALLGALAPLVVWLVKRWVERREDPATQNRRRHEQAEADVARQDGAGASVHGVDDLEELDRLEREAGRKQALNR